MDLIQLTACENSGHGLSCDEEDTFNTTRMQFAS